MLDALILCINQLHFGLCDLLLIHYGFKGAVFGPFHLVEYLGLQSLLLQLEFLLSLLKHQLQLIQVLFPFGQRRFPVLQLFPLQGLFFFPGIFFQRDLLLQLALAVLEFSFFVSKFPIQLLLFLMDESHFVLIVGLPLILHFLERLLEFLIDFPSYSIRLFLLELLHLEFQSLL